MIQEITPVFPHAHAHTHARRLFVLIACEESQAECMAFRQLGHIAFSCDLQKARYRYEWHIQGDVMPLLKGGTTFVTMDGHIHSIPHWDLIIAHPPCTYLCKVSSVHMRQHGVLNKERYDQMIKARAFFFACLNASAPYVAVENPLPMAIAHLPKPSCFIQPSWFGVKYTKKTLYWLKNLPPILAEIEFPNPKCFVSASRGKYRSRTFPQVANAIARQWAEYIISDTMI